MAKMIQIPYDYTISIPVSTAQAVQSTSENPVSLSALGLLVNLLSYPATWELYKTELYKRFAENKERSVKAAWDNLMAANYIIEFRYRSGKKWEYVYYYRRVPFSPEEKTGILDTATKEYGKIWGLQNEVPRLQSSKRRVNKELELNKEPLLNKDQVIDDDKRTSPLGEDSAIWNDEHINLVISSFREATKEEISERSYKSVVRKVVDKYSQGKVGSFRDYLVTALLNKINALELRRQKDDAKKQTRYSKEQTLSNLKNVEIKEPIAFYNWLDE